MKLLVLTQNSIHLEVFKKIVIYKLLFNKKNHIKFYKITEIAYYNSKILLILKIIK